MPLNVHAADDPLLILTMQMTFMAENLAIVLNIILIAFFHYQLKQNQKSLMNRHHSSVSGAASSPKSSSTLAHSHSVSRSSSVNSRKNKSKAVSKQTLQVTYALLFVGFMFSICQGLIENWLAPDCGAEWLQWCTFFFYFTHRCLLLTAFLHRLMIVFKGSIYAYPSIFYYILLIGIICYGFIGYIIYGLDYFIVKVDIKMWHGSGGNILCSWGFGEKALGVRVIELILTLVLLSAFLYKLGKLHLDTSALMEHEMDGNGKSKEQTKLTSKLLVIFRKITFLTLAALCTSVVVTFGYINFKPLAFALSLDAVFNSFCVVLMFQFNHKIIRPCFGNKCDRCFCVKFVGNCHCVLLNACNNDDDDDVVEEIIDRHTKMNALPTRSVDATDTKTFQFVGTPSSVEMESHNDAALSGLSAGEENQTGSEESK